MIDLSPPFPSEVLAEALVVPEEREGASHLFGFVDKLFVDRFGLNGRHFFVVIEGRVHSHEGVNHEGLFAVALQVEERVGGAGAGSEARFVGKAHGIVVLNTAINQVVEGHGEREAEEVGAVEDNVAMKEVGQAFTFHSEELGVVEGGVGRMESDFGVIAEVLQEQLEILVLIGDGFVVDVVVRHEGKENELDIGEVLMDIDDEVERVERVWVFVG